MIIINTFNAIIVEKITISKFYKKIRDIHKIVKIIFIINFNINAHK